MDFNEEVIKSPMLEAVSLSKEKRDEISKFVKEVVAAKSVEEHHKKDNEQEEKRWTTGFCGESALEQFLGEGFVDLTVGNSNGYHVSDLSKLGLDIGVKTVEKGKFPIIFKNSKYPQIIVIKDSDSRFTIAGLATVEVLNKYQSDDLILSPALRARGTKTGFYGFEHLKKFDSISDLKLMTKHVPNGTRVHSKIGVVILEYKDGKYFVKLETTKELIGTYDLIKINKKLKNMTKKDGIYYPIN